MCPHVSAAPSASETLAALYCTRNMSSIYAWMSNLWDNIVSSYETFSVFLNREPWLTIRRILWVVTAGWVLATSYVVAALGMILSIVFIPFAPTALRFAW